MPRGNHFFLLFTSLACDKTFFCVCFLELFQIIKKKECCIHKKKEKPWPIPFTLNDVLKNRIISS